MRQFEKMLCALIAFPAFSLAANAGDAQAGEKLHQENCISCHVSMAGGDGSGLYTRADRRVGSFDSLVTQVNRCNVNLGVGWFDDEVEAVAAYLNTQYYKF
jgi:mono/diheme cytochrome c family protein